MSTEQKDLSTFLSEWGEQVKELIEPNVVEKLTPEFELLGEISDSDGMSTYYSVHYTYVGDGELTLFYPESSYGGLSLQSSENTISVYINEEGYVSGTATVTSAETDNYKAGEWTFSYYYGYF